MWTKMDPVWLLKPPPPGPQIAKDVNVFHIWKTYYVLLGPLDLLPWRVVGRSVGRSVGLSVRQHL